VACLEALAGPAPAEGPPAASAKMPVPWLLLDLMAMLPDGSKLKPSTEASRATAVQGLCAAESDATAAARAAGKLSRELARHQGSLHQLADYELMSPAALELVLAGLHQAGPAAGQAACSIAMAAWRSLAASSAQLTHGILAGPELDQAKADALAGMEAARQLTGCVQWLLGGRDALKFVGDVVQEVGGQVLAVLQKCWQLSSAAAANGSTASGGSGPGRGQMQQLAGWWAAEASYAACHADRSLCARVCDAALASARHFLTISLPDMLAMRSIEAAALQRGSLLHSTAKLLSDLVQCSQGGAAPATQKGAGALLRAYNCDFVELLHSLLTLPAHPAMGHLQQAANYGSPGAAGQLRGASEMYVWAVSALLDAIVAAGVVGPGGEEQLSHLVEVVVALQWNGGLFQDWLALDCQAEIQARSQGAIRPLYALLTPVRTPAHSGKGKGQVRPRGYGPCWDTGSARSPDGPGSGSRSSGAPSYAAALQGQCGGRQQSGSSGSSSLQSHPMPGNTEGSAGEAQKAKSSSFLDVAKKWFFGSS
jgi:hypothetical protein